MRTMVSSVWDGVTDSLPSLKEQGLQVFWSVTAIVSLLVMIFILTRE